MGSAAWGKREKENFGARVPSRYCLYEYWNPGGKWQGLGVPLLALDRSHQPSSGIKSTKSEFRSRLVSEDPDLT